MKILKTALLALWICYWIICAIDHFIHNKEMSVWSGTLLLTMLFLSYSSDNDND